MSQIRKLMDSLDAINEAPATTDQMFAAYEEYGLDHASAFDGFKCAWNHQQKEIDRLTRELADAKTPHDWGNSEPKWPENLHPSLANVRRESRPENPDAQE